MNYRSIFADLQPDHPRRCGQPRTHPAALIFHIRVAEARYAASRPTSSPPWTEHFSRHNPYQLDPGSLKRRQWIYFEGVHHARDPEISAFTRSDRGHRMVSRHDMAQSEVGRTASADSDWAQDGRLGRCRNRPVAAALYRSEPWSQLIFYSALEAFVFRSLHESVVPLMDDDGESASKADAFG